MVICTVEVNEKATQTIVIGRRGTYNTQEVVFDIGYLIDAYGAGTAVLAIKRSQDSSAYPTVVTQEDTTLTWTVSETDTYYVGAGECQLMWYVDGGLAKTIIYPLVVMRDILSTSEEAPDAYQGWVDNLTALGAKTLQNARDAALSASEAESAKNDAVDAKEASEEAARKAEESSVHAPIIVNGYWYAWDATTETYQNTGVKAEGRDGTDGFSPVITVTDITGGHRVTITDAEGTQTVDVMNGTDGTNGDDGYSPVVTVTNITGGHRVTITDKTHPSGQSFDVMDGQDGASDAGEVTYDETATYPSGSVGAELSHQKNAISQKAPLIINTASGDIASFADGADGMQIRKLVGTIVPVQDLHGYDNPWPAGSSRNKFNLDATTQTSNGVTFTVNSDKTISTSGTASGTAVFRFNMTYADLPQGESLTLNGTPSGGDWTSKYGMALCNSSGGPIGNHFDTGNGAVYTATELESLAQFQIVVRSGINADGLVFKPMIRLASETDDTFVPCSNLCPINGHTGMTVARTGKNLFNKNAVTTGKYLDANGEILDSIAFCISEYIPVKAPCCYSGANGFFGSTPCSCFYDENKNFISSVHWVNTTAVVTVPDGAKFIRISIRPADLDTFQFEFGSSVTEYKPFSGTTIPISWQTEAGTVYGGYIDVVSGALVVTEVGKVYDGTETGWVWTASYQQAHIPLDRPAFYNVNQITWKCNLLTPHTNANRPSYIGNYSSLVSSGGSAAFSAPDCTTLAEFLSYISNNNLQFVYRLATPIEYTLSANELNTLYGTNNIWIDTGSITECDYPADTKLYIDNKIATAIANALNA